MNQIKDTYFLNYDEALKTAIKQNFIKPFEKQICYYDGEERETNLDNLIIIYDSNDVTLDAMAEASQSEDTAQRFIAYGFDVVPVKKYRNHQSLRS